MSKIINLILITTILSLILSYYPSVSYAKNTQQYIALLNLEAKGVTSEEASIITDRFRAHFVNMSKFKVMERSNMDKILKEQGFQQTEYCNTTECSVKIGQILSVNVIITGSVTKLGGIFSINVRMLDVQTGQIIKEDFEDCKCPIEDVLSTVTKNIANKIAGNLNSEIEVKPPDNTIPVPDNNNQPSNILSPPTTPNERSDRVRLYKQTEKWWGVSSGLSLIPIIPCGYIYLEEWAWLLGYLGVEGLTLLAAARGGNAGTLTGGLFIAYILSIIHTPIITAMKNDEIKKRYGITDEDIKKYSAAEGLIEFYAGKPSDGLYLDINTNVGLFYRLNF